MTADTKTAPHVQPIEIPLPEPSGAVAVVERNGGHVPAAPRESTASAIFELMRDPNTDAARLKEFMGMYRELIAEEARLDFDAAMSDAQSEMKPVVAELVNKAANNNKYPSQVAVDDAIRPLYTKHGFSVDFDTGDSPLPGHVRLICNVSHRSGHQKVRRFDICADGAGPKGGAVMSKAHAEVSAVTLGKRTLLGMVFNLAVNKDDDGNAASGVPDADAKPKISAAQIAELQKLIEDTGGSVNLFLKHISRPNAVVATLGDIFADKFQAAVKIVKDTEAQRKKAKTK